MTSGIVILAFEYYRRKKWFYVNRIKQGLKNRWNILLIAGIYFWAKTILAYYIDFSLGVEGWIQTAILWINPIATMLLLFSSFLYIKKLKPALIVLWLADLLNTLVLYINIIYYREFTDFVTIKSILGFSKVSEGISGSSLALMRIHDIFYWLDIFLLLAGIIYLFVKKVDITSKPVKKTAAVAVSIFSVLFFTVNLSVSEANRPQLLQRTFDRNYLVKYLGLDTFTAVDGFNTAKANEVRANASSGDINDVLNYTKSHYAAPDESKFGIAKNRNIIVLHLESFQQFLINMKVDGQEVTPFLNSLYNDDQQTLSFDNFFNQVGQGKTSDAENMLETSTYGLPQGSLFTQLGSDNTFQAAPAILNQTEGYSSAVFHGNVGSFWNREDVYKNLGYQNFFDKSYFSSDDETLGYGILDKDLLRESVSHLEHLQQPFYTKFLTVTNHTPYLTDNSNFDFPSLNTGDEVVDNYVRTAHYLDQSLEQFFTYLKASGIYQKSIFMIYGDHYGISDTNNPDLAETLGKDKASWDSYDNAMLQRVPLMFHIPGYTGGGVQHQYGGEIDVLPTLLHLVGVDTKNYVQFGSDLLSENHDQVVAFRNGDFVTPQYTELGGKTYDTNTGELIDSQAAGIETEIQNEQQNVKKELELSDKLNEENLLRFYTPEGFTAVDPKSYNYKNLDQQNEDKEKQLGAKSTSIFSENNDQTTINLYPTDNSTEE
ncbi:lipoteichoic acid synthase [Enterococcus sp. AZ103]